MKVSTRLIPAFKGKINLFLFVLGAGFFVSCASSSKKPVKHMVFASAAETAAKQAGAERKAPDAFRKAESFYWKAKTAYQRKRWDEARKASILARRYFEMAERNAEVKSALSGGGGFY